MWLLPFLLIAAFASTPLRADDVQEKPPSHSSGGCGFFATADYLYWKADEDGLEYVFAADSPPEKTPVLNGRLIAPHLNWDSGFRAGIGYAFGRSGWDLALEWTYFRTSGSNFQAVSNAHSFTLIQTWFPSSLGTNALQTAADWKLHFDTIDLKLGCDYSVTKALSLKPFFGARGALIDQVLKAYYEGGSFNPAVFTEFRGRNNFHGIGLLGGLNIHFHLNRNWSFYGKLAGSLLYGKFDVDETVADFQTGKNFHRVRTSLEAGGGLQWEMAVKKGAMRLVLTAGYELQEWFRQNEMQQFMNSAGGLLIKVPQKGDLGLQGLTISARMDF